MSGLIPKRWPDIEQWFIGWVTAAKIAAVEPTLTGALIRNQKPTTPKPDGTVNAQATPPYRQVIIAADYGQLITPVSRYVRLRMQTWVVLANGTANLKESFDLANVAAFIAAQAPRNANPIISVEVDAGPSRVEDALTGIEYNATTLLLEVGAL